MDFTPLPSWAKVVWIKFLMPRNRYEIVRSWILLLHCVIHSRTDSYPNTLPPMHYGPSIFNSLWDSNENVYFQKRSIYFLKNVRNVQFFNICIQIWKKPNMTQNYFNQKWKTPSPPPFIPSRFQLQEKNFRSLKGTDIDLWIKINKKENVWPA